MKPRKRSAGAVGGLVAAVGFGIAIWFGWDWYQLPRWTETDIEASVELNLTLDMKRLPQDVTPPIEMIDRMRDQIRAQVEKEIEKDREAPRGYTLGGLLIGLFGLAQMLVRMWIAKRDAST